MTNRGDVLTWEEVLEECSRLHTTRTRVPSWIQSAGNSAAAEEWRREDSRVLDVLVDGRPVRLTPTRMHEPGFYGWRQDEDAPIEDGRMFPVMLRSRDDLSWLEHEIRAGRVVRA